MNSYMPYLFFETSAQARPRHYLVILTIDISKALLTTDISMVYTTQKFPVKYHSIS